MKLIAIGVKVLQVLMSCCRGSYQDVHVPTPLKNAGKDPIVSFPGAISVEDHYESLSVVQFRDSTTPVVHRHIQTAFSSDEISLVYSGRHETSMSDIPNYELHSFK